MNTKEFQEIIHDTQKNILFVRVNEKTADIDDDDFKNAQYEIVDEIINTKSTSVIINVQKLLFSVSPELQQWVAQDIAPKIFENGVTKMGYIMPTEFIEKLAIEQISDEMGEKVLRERVDFGMEFFDDETEAINWCVSNHATSQKV